MESAEASAENANPGLLLSHGFCLRAIGSKANLIYCNETGRVRE